MAGDIYDGADRSLRAQLKFVDGLARLDAAGIRSFVCHGNHDPLDGWEARLSLPPGCVRFGPEVSGEPVFPGEPERATVYGVSYPQRVVTENLALHFNGQVSSGFSIGLLHCNVGGNTSHDNYSPCTVSDLAETAIDYWALGHVHTRQVLRQERPTAVYPGNPQGRHPLETGERGVYLVEVDDYGAVSLDFRPVDVVRWETLEVSIAALEAEQELIDAIDSAAASCAEYAGGRSVVFRLTLAGRGPLHRWLRSAGTVEELRERINEQYAPSTSSGQVVVVVRADSGGHGVAGGPGAGGAAGGLRGRPGPAQCGVTGGPRCAGRVARCPAVAVRQLQRRVVSAELPAVRRRTDGTAGGCRR